MSTQASATSDHEITMIHNDRSLKLSWPKPYRPAGMGLIA